MKKAKIFLQKILYPPVWIYFTVVPASFVLLAFAFAGNMTESVTAYISYGLSAYSLAVLIAEAVRLLRKRKRIADRFSEILKSNKIGKRYMENAAFRGSINSMSGIVIDFAYAAFRGVSGVLYGSVWFISMAAYHIALGCMRVYLRACKIKADRNPKERRTAFEKRAYKTTAWLLLLLNIPDGEVRLMGAYIIKCNEVIQDENGNITEIRCTADLEVRNGNPTDRKIKGTIHWLSARFAKEAKVMLYEQLFTEKDMRTVPSDQYNDRLNPNSAVKLEGCMIEPSLADAEPGDRFQFVRTGYFCKDTKYDMTFNRIVGLRDSFKK